MSDDNISSTGNAGLSSHAWLWLFSFILIFHNASSNIVMISFSLAYSSSSWASFSLIKRKAFDLPPSSLVHSLNEWIMHLIWSRQTLKARASTCSASPAWWESAFFLWMLLQTYRQEIELCIVARNVVKQIIPINQLLLREQGSRFVWHKECSQCFPLVYHTSPLSQPSSSSWMYDQDRVIALDSPARTGWSQ